MRVATLDIKSQYNPDILGSVLAMPIPDDSYDMVIACEILEHLPWEEFPTALHELHRVTKKSALISLPDVRHIFFALHMRVPFFQPWYFLLKVPTLTKNQFNPAIGHYFEIGKRGFPVSKISREITKAGFAVTLHRVPFDTPKNHYFFLEKNVLHS